MESTRHPTSATRFAAIAICAIVASLLFSGLPTLADPAAELAARPNTLPDFALPDSKGVEHTRNEWREAKAVVLVFLGAECPVSNGYSPTFRQLVEKFTPRGVLVLGVHSDPTLSAESAIEHAREYALPFATLLDGGQVLARGCGVRVTPEAVVLRASGEVVYRGRIDNKYSPDGKRRDLATTFNLEAALEAALAGKLPAIRQTTAFGCPLPRAATK